MTKKTKTTQKKARGHLVTKVRIPVVRRGKAKPSAGSRILQGAREALAFAQGEREGFRVHVPEEVDVKAVREGLDLSQAKFAEAFGFTVDAIRNWEQGRRQPEGPARVLLTVIQREPEAVLRALTADPTIEALRRRGLVEGSSGTVLTKTGQDLMAGKATARR